MNETCNILILAAGFGTRLGDFGRDTPKGLIKTGATTILGRLLDDLKTVSKHKQILVTNHVHAPLYHSWLKKSGYESITLIDNGVSDPVSRQGALKDAALALQHLSLNQSLSIVPSDTLYDFSLKEFIQVAQSHPDGLTTVFRRFPDKTSIQNRLGCGVIQAGRLIAFVEKPSVPPSVFGAIPFYYYPSSTLPLINQYLTVHPDLAASDAPGSIIPWLLQTKHSVYAHIINSTTLDVGTPADLLAANHFKVQ